MKITLLNQKFTLKEALKLKKPIIRTMLSPKKIINFLKVNISKKLKLKKPLGYPYLLMIEPSSICNLKCPMCPIVLNKTKRKNKGNMTFETFKKVIDEIGDYLIAISLWNYGEPLLNPDFSKMISYAKKKNIITVVSTNGMLMEEQLNKQIIKSGLDYLILSFDGATKKTYEKYRGKGANFEKVVSNLKSLTSLKKQMKKSNPFINLQFIVMKENEHEIPLIKEFSKTLSIDKLSLKKFTFVGESMDNFLPKKEKYILGKYKRKTQMKTCARLWDSSVVSWDGTIIPCCGDLNFEFNFGNINTENFKNIWKNQKYQILRNQILNNINSIKMCQTCPSNDFTTDMFIDE